MHHVNDCQNLGRNSEGKNPVVQTLWSLGGHLAQFAHFSRLSKRQSPAARIFVSYLLDWTHALQPHDCCVFSLALYLPLQPHPPLPDWGRATEAGVMATTKFTLLLGHRGSRERENSLQSWEEGATVVLQKASYTPVGVWPMPEILALRRLRQKMESSRPVHDSKKC